MSSLLRILLGGFALFMLLAVAQRWDYFSAAWFDPPETMAALEPEQRDEAVAAVREMLSVAGHLLASGGDPRFADRLPGSEAVRQEILEDARYLSHNRMKQVSTLLKFELLAVQPLAPERVEVVSREFWVHRLESTMAEGPAPPSLSQVVRGRYVVGRQGGRWHVQAWDFDALGGAPEGTEPAASAAAQEGS